ncbi:hypothetical protein LCDVSa164L [Lymphocystis disease virus 3]|uniref:Uncharacterized protein n=1 Tax=Lymphocystis disease virus 3 TaxID=2560566 RepID=A0A1B2RW75_9VIRU|nr:hypothetical protein BZK12_gp164 [Lymphocystis disease virus Sa]AOC55248.1 hypothetical protein LCDVSa164L [Lymphocystis disease virus 3]
MAIQEKKYYIFNISTMNPNRLFIADKVLKQFEKICVYAKKNITVEKAIENDGRFIDFKNFKLRDLNADKIFNKTVYVQEVSGKTLEVLFSNFTAQDVESLKSEVTSSRSIEF